MQGLDNMKREWYLSNLLVDVALDEQLNVSGRLLGDLHPPRKHKLAGNARSSNTKDQRNGPGWGSPKLWLLQAGKAHRS